MLKRIIITICGVFIAVYAHAYDEQKIASKVQKVTVFLNSAQVTRTATVNISPGTNTLVFESISPDIDVQSLQVRAAGDFTILSVKHELDFVNEQLKASRVQDLVNQRKLVQNKLDIQNSLSEIYQEEKNMMLKNQTITGDNSNLDLVRLRQALDFQTARLTELKRKQQLVNEQVAALYIELQKFDKQIADVSRGSSKATSNVLVTISSKAATQSLFTLSYVVRNASWYPTYDIRAKNVNSPISIAYKANVSQQCGEDWKNIKLTLSTGNPTVSGGKPSLAPNYLNFGMYYSVPQGSITRVMGTVADETGVALPGATVIVKGTSIGTVTDMAGRYSIQIPSSGPQVLIFKFIGYTQQEIPANREHIDVKLSASTQSLDEVTVVGYGTGDKRVKSALQGRLQGLTSTASINTIPIEVQQTENQTNVEFNIENPYSVPSDGKQYLVEINNIEIEAAYQYYVAPKVSTDVFLTATITDWNKYNFLSGEANIFFEGTFIGKSLIDTYSTNDTLSLSLGTDKNIVVTRTLQKDMEKKASGSTKKETRDWLITIKNRKNQPVSLLLEDQIPVAQNAAIEVEAQDISGGKLDATTGKLSWDFTLNPQQEKKIQLKYQVRYPKNQSVIVQ